MSLSVYMLPASLTNWARMKTPLAAGAVQEEGLSKPVHIGGRSVQLSKGGGACGVGGKSVCLRWPAITAASDVQAVLALRRRSCC